MPRAPQPEQLQINAAGLIYQPLVFLAVPIKESAAPQREASLTRSMPTASACRCCMCAWQDEHDCYQECYTAPPALAGSTGLVRNSFVSKAQLPKSSATSLFQLHILAEPGRATRL